MDIRPIDTSDIFADAKNLIAEYAAECSIPLIGPIDPQPEMYERLQDVGVLKCFGAYAGEEMAGFATVLITMLPHYGKQVATVESIFVRSSHRASRAGLGLLKAIEQYARVMGCAAILYSAPVGGQFEKLLSRRLKKTNTIFCRSLA